jgi:uncharacterized protein YecT (DUF1311 family)
MASAAASPCADPQDQQTMNHCAYQDFLAADKALNAQWKLTSDEMKARDRDLDRTWDKAPGHMATLLTAQRAWLKYRDAHCASEGNQFRGGSMEPLIVATCRTSLTEARTKQLKDLIEQQ